MDYSYMPVLSLIFDMYIGTEWCLWRQCVTTAASYSSGRYLQGYITILVRETHLLRYHQAPTDMQYAVSSVGVHTLSM